MSSDCAFTAGHRHALKTKHTRLVGLASAFSPRYTQCFGNFLKRRKIDLKVTNVCVPKKA